MGGVILKVHEQKHKGFASMVLVIANVTIEDKTTQWSLNVPKRWSRGLIFEIVAEKLGHRNFSVGYSFQEISIRQ